jgi:hypothetical protein
MSKESQDFRNQAAAEYRASRKNGLNGTGEILRNRAEAYKALAENEKWLSGETVQQEPKLGSFA